MTPATEPQTNYLSILFVDCGMTREQRKAWLKNRFGAKRKFVFLDELTTGEAHAAIGELLKRKEEKW